MQYEVIFKSGRKMIIGVTDAFIHANIILSTVEKIIAMPKEKICEK